MLAGKASIAETVMWQHFLVPIMSNIQKPAKWPDCFISGITQSREIELVKRD